MSEHIHPDMHERRLESLDSRGPTYDPLTTPTTDGPAPSPVHPIFQTILDSVYRAPQQPTREEIAESKSKRADRYE